MTAAGWYAADIEYLLGEVRRLREDLTQLRDAWNTHMRGCPQQIAIPTWAQLGEWANAPSNTASAALRPDPGEEANG